ncbi:DUF7065 domain-containing protein [Methanobacterium petrolearium]|uniref:DUF7065 domain-containing protein n=1 Tax=Methanobacterium petrolearium TaxID=710190 RepID=UPI001AE3831C|nr:hypothetical protein [Methanobacterium petrolearium]MBP1946691.1 hypothetical protein [Methanobacterium petrolearium]BDZ70935.1 hypothetical protein GCM10025861_14520 [Methanobacterium petrolearium]
MDNDLKTLKKHEEWNESYYFNFHDKNNDLTAFMRIGNKINKNEKSMFFFLMTPQVIAGIKLETPCDDKPLNIAGLNYEEMASGKWKLKFDGSIFDPLSEVPQEFKVKMNIFWEALNPVMDYVDCVDEKQTEMSLNVASEHYEQFGKATGIVKIDDEIFEIEALGERDLSRGVRDWGSPKMWMWINSEFSHNEALNITKLSIDEGDVDAGYFYTGSVNEPLIKSDIDVKLDNGIPSTFKMSLFDKKGSIYQVNGEVIRLGMIPVDERMILIETLSRYNWEGKEGYGVAEFLVPKPG